MSRVLLTGASGFIGGALAPRLLDEGHQVRCLVRASSNTRALEALAGTRGELQLCRGDLRDRGSLVEAVASAEVVVHAAAMVSDWGTVSEIRAANATASAELARAAAEAGVRRLVHLSSTDVYGHPGGQRISEDYVPGGFANWYAQTKREAEAALTAISAQTGLELVILRPATVYGPGSDDVVGELARALVGGYLPLIGGGRALAGLVYVDNVVDAVLAAMARSAAVGESFNVSEESALTWRGFITDLADGLGVHPPRIGLPATLAAGLGIGLEEGYRLLRRLTGLSTPALLSRQAVQVLVRDQDFSNAKLRRRLGWEPRVGYEAGLEATLRWLSEDFLAPG